MLKIFLSLFFIFINLNALEKIKIGVLAYGTVNWELDVLKYNNLDTKNGYELEFVKLASKNAQIVALQSNSVDIIVNDWIWVNAQIANKKEFAFFPYSKATGTIYIPNESSYKTLLDLKGENLGISGGAFDKTWLILRAYSKNKYGEDLKNIVNPMYAGAPILYEKMINKSLNASINYWHFNSKLKAKGFKPLIDMTDVLKQLDVKEDLSFVGWTFNKSKAEKNRALYNAFLKSTFEAKDILLSSQKEWDRIKPLMNVKDTQSFESLIHGYKQGVVKDFSNENIEASKKIFKIFLDEKNSDFLGAKILDENIFWKYENN